MKAVQFGSADAWIDNYATSRFLIDSHHLTNLQLGSEIKGIDDHQFFKHHIGVRKDSPILRDILDKAMDEISPEELQQLRERWRIYSEKVQQLKLSLEEQEWLENNQVLLLGFDSNWAPIEFADDQGSFKGMSSDYLRLIGEVLGITVQHVGPQSRTKLISAIEKGAVDLLPAVVRSSKNEEKLDFTRPYLSFPVVIATSQQVAYISEMRELLGKTITVLDTSTIYGSLSRDYPEITIQPVKTVSEGLRMVLTGKVFGFIGTLPCISHRIVRDNIAGLKISGKTPYRVDLSVGVKKGDTILAGLVQKAMDTITDEKKQEIHNRWFAVSYERGFDYSLLGKILIPVTVFIILLIFWNRQLNRMVARRTAALRRIEEQYRNIVESTQDYYFFYTHDTQGHFTFISPSITGVLGYSPQEFLTHYNRYLTDNPTNQQIDRLTGLALKGEEQPPYEIEIYHKNGAKQWLEVKESPVFDKKHQVIAIEGVARNITESKKTQKELDEYREHLEELVNERTEELSENEERFRTLVSHSPGAVYRCVNDEEMTLWYISEAIYEISGYRPEDFTTNRVRTYTSIIHPEDALYVEDVIQTCIREKRQFDLTYRILHAKGDIRWVDERGTGVFNDAGELEWLEGIVIDVTERKLAEEKLQQYMDDLERFNRLAIGREQQIIKLKKEINSLLKHLGRKIKFKSVE